MGHKFLIDLDYSDTGRNRGSESSNVLPSTHEYVARSYYSTNRGKECLWPAQCTLCYVETCQQDIITDIGHPLDPDR